MSALLSDAILSLLVAGQPHCTAFLIAPDRAVTAAHCVVGEPTEHLTLAANGHPATVKVRNTYCLGRFRLGTWRYDVAVLSLQRRTEVRPLRVCLSHCFAAARPAGSYSFAGYGSLRHPPSELATLRRGEARIGRIDDRFVWLAPAAELPCYGDSGAPLLAPDGRAVAVHVGGDPRCHASARFVRLDAPSLRALFGALKDRRRSALVSAPC